MINDRTRLLVNTIKKLYHRGAFTNIQKILSKTHNADVATILQMLADEEAAEIFRLEKRPEQRAQILSYLDDDFQRILLTHLTNQEVTDAVDHMEPDDAADLLGRLPDEESQNIIEGLKSEDSSEVVGLMGYPEDSAGGIMSSDYLAFPETATVAEVVLALQGDEAENKVTFYVYVVNHTEHLVGVVSLKQLLLSRKSTSLRELMTTNVISVKTDTDQEQVAATVARYDFLSIPVVDETNCLVGVITVDDVIDVIKQEAEEDLLSMAQAGWGVDMNWFEHFVSRLPWLLLSYSVGAISFFLILWLIQTEGVKISDLWAKAALIPLLLSLGAMSGNQAATVIVGAVQTGKFWGGKLWVHVMREIFMGSIWALIFGALVYGLGLWLIPNDPLPLALAVATQMALSMTLGLSLPLIIQKLKFDPLVLTTPIYASMADISALLILFGLYHA